MIFIIMHDDHDKHDSQDDRDDHYDTRRKYEGVCGVFSAWIIELWIRTSNYLNDKDKLASLYYHNDNGVCSHMMIVTNYDDGI